MHDLLANLEYCQQQLAEGFGRPDPWRAQQLLTSRGAEVLAVGSHRVGVALGEREVAKVAWSRPGLADNDIEWRLWQLIEPEVREFLCPSLALLASGILIQTRCLPVSAEAYPGEARQLVERLARAGITDAAANLGILDERLVCYDYCVVRGELLRRLL